MLLLLHGNFMWSFAFRHLINELAKDYRCIAIDLAGMGMSSKPHQDAADHNGYTLKSQSHLVEQMIVQLGLTHISLFAHDHGGPIGFGVAVRQPELFENLIITNSWAWSNHEYKATRRWSKLAPMIPWLTYKLLFRKPASWIFESQQELAKPGVWEACTAPFASPADLLPALILARQLTSAREFFVELEAGLPKLAGKRVEIFWATRTGRMFPEFTDEGLFLARWQSIFPNARVTLMPNASYYFLSRPPELLLRGLRRISA